MDKNKALLIINTSKTIPEQAVSSVTDLLLTHRFKICVFPSALKLVSGLVDESQIEVLSENSIPSDISFAVVFGGDGSIIRAASVLSGKDIPMIGVNFGGIGYLSELESNDISLISKIIDHDYEIDSRMMLDAVVYRESGEIIKSSSALNDVVLSNGPIANLLSFELFCNGVKLRKFRADGVIIATATGSTAYSMSAGGPVLDPSLSAVCITPICPHEIGNRPFVIPGDSFIELKNIVFKKNSVYLSIDGREVIELFEGDTVRIEKSQTVTRLIRLKTKDFLGVLNHKLS